MFHRGYDESFAKFHLQLRTVTHAVLTLFSIWYKKFKNHQNNEKPSHSVISYELLTMKNNKLEILRTFMKSVLKQSYHIQSLMALKPNDQCYGHVHGIVFVWMSPYCANMFVLAWHTMFLKEVFNFILRKIHFSFSEYEKGAFCEASTKNVLQNDTTIFLQNIRPNFKCKWPIGSIAMTF